MNILKTVIAVLAVIIFVTLIVTSTQSFYQQSDWLSWLLIGLSIVGLIVSLATNIKRNSPPKLGNITRYEFYIALIGIAGWMFQINSSLNSRIDTLFTIIK